MLINLQILRAFAAINVVLFHAIQRAASYGFKAQTISKLDGWGANGVDIFFVISGFIMLYIQIKRRQSIKDFLLQRVIRIVPVYWIFTLTLAALYYELPLLFRSTELNLNSLLNSLFFISHVFYEEFPVVYVGWTLEWEMAFYLIFGLSLFFKNATATIAFTSVGVILVFLLTSNYLLFEFLIGIIIAWTYNKPSLQRFGRFSLAAGCLIISLSLFIDFGEGSRVRFFTWGLPSALIVYGAVYSPQAKKGIISFLGNASYSIYLIQVATIPAFYKAISFTGINLNHDLLVLLCLFVTIVFGLIFHLLIERPTINLVRKLCY